MSVKDYFKERKLLFLFSILTGIFCFLVYWTESDLGNSSLEYMIQGIFVFFVIYICIDYFILRSRIKRIQRFITNGASDEENFIYPIDNIYTNEVLKLLTDFNAYKMKTEEQYTDELDFITKWVHDVKVPISAIYLLLEGLEEENAEKIEMQISYIEQYTQNVLYHMKSKSFHDDYKISKVSTQMIISSALKRYATFFSNKKIVLTLCENSFDVLTDEKWSGYIISQILSNAVKYTPEHGEIKIRVFERGNKTIISVWNTGNGIDGKNIDQIFKRGYTSQNKRSGSSSTGYGLYLSKKLADRMGHDLFAVSKENEYVEFCLVFSQIYDHYNLTKM